MPDVASHFQTFDLEEQPFMTLCIAHNQIREEQDPSLQFDFACRSAICGSCGMLVNGRPRLACRTLTRELPERIQLRRLLVFKLVADLSVDTGSWFRGMAERAESWIHESAPFDPEVREERMDPDFAQAIYEGERCIACGCCIAGCGVANLNPDFVGAAGLNRIARFMRDPRDERRTRTSSRSSPTKTVSLTASA